MTTKARWGCAHAYPASNPRAKSWNDRFGSEAAVDDSKDERLFFSVGHSEAAIPVS